MNKYALPVLAAGFLAIVCGAAAPAAAYDRDGYGDRDRDRDRGEYCREYTRRVTIGGRIETSYGYACLQPDGQWLIDGDRNRPLPSQAVYYDEAPRYVPSSRRPVYFIEDDYRGHHKYKHKKHGHDRYRDPVVYYGVPAYYYYP